MTHNINNSFPFSSGWELTPLKYNSKLMNSIWGLYNRYSVHNFKKNNSNEGVLNAFVAAWNVIFHNRAPAANSVTAAAVAKNNFSNYVKEREQYLIRFHF